MAKQLQQQPMQYTEQYVAPKTATAGGGQQPPEDPPSSTKRYYGRDDDDARYSDANNDKYLNRNRGGMHHHRGYGYESYGERVPNNPALDFSKESKKMGKKPLDIPEQYPLGRAGER